MIETKNDETQIQTTHHTIGFITEHARIGPLFPIEREPASFDDFIVQVESVYRGLGIPVLYGVLSTLANKSVFFIGGRGLGKTRIIKTVPDLEGTYGSNWDTFTYKELDSLCSLHKGSSNDIQNDCTGVCNKDFLFKVEEFSTLSEYHREVFLSVCSKIASDGNFIHVTDVTPNLEIHDCRLTMLIAIQPLVYSLLCNRYVQWESMSYDRFSKFLVLNPLRQGNTVDSAFIPTLTRKIPPSASLPKNIDLSRMTILYEGQISLGRAPLYARDYAIAAARFLGKNTVEQSDVDLFYKLFSPYLEPFSDLQHREDLDSPVMVSSGHLELLTEIGKHLEGINKQSLAVQLLVTVRHIERCASFLLLKELVREEEGRYHLSTELEQFFIWYRDAFSVKMSVPARPNSEHATGQANRTTQVTTESVEGEGCQ